MRASFVCSCWACFIKSPKFAMIAPLYLSSALTWRTVRAGRGLHFSAENVQDGFYQGVTFRLVFLRLDRRGCRRQCRRGGRTTLGHLDREVTPEKPPGDVFQN